jgi:hypothetical protein
MLHKKLPPYAAPLQKLQLENNPPANSVNIFIGMQAWKKAKAFSVSHPTRCIALPAWESPINYIWPIKGCDILIVDTGYAEKEYLEDLVYCLYQSGATIVRGVTPDFSLIVYHKE